MSDGEIGYGGWLVRETLWWEWNTAATKPDFIFFLFFLNLHIYIYIYIYIIIQKVWTFTSSPFVCGPLIVGLLFWCRYRSLSRIHSFTIHWTDTCKKLTILSLIFLIFSNTSLTWSIHVGYIYPCRTHVLTLVEHLLVKCSIQKIFVEFSKILAWF